MANWSGLTVGDLFERIRLSMPEGRPGTLSRQQNADILAYMLSVNQFPAGKTELQRIPTGSSRFASWPKNRSPENEGSACSDYSC